MTNYLIYTFFVIIFTVRKQTKNTAMKTCHYRLYFLLTIVLLSSLPLFLKASTFKKTSLEIVQKHLTKDSITVDQLLAQLSDATPIQRIKILRDLQKFDLNDYSDSNKKQIGSYLDMDKAPSEALIFLCGFLQLESTLLVLLEKHKKNKPLLQKIKIALVRAGNLSKANTLRKNIEKLSINDPFVYEVLPLLAYTKERIIYDWLLDQILLDERNCHPADAEGAGNINCAFRIMEAVAPGIIDFPVGLDKWGDLDVDSYSKALTTVRDWITTHQKDYTIDKQTY